MERLGSGEKVYKEVPSLAMRKDRVLRNVRLGATSCFTEPGTLAGV